MYNRQLEYFDLYLESFQLTEWILRLNLLPEGEVQLCHQHEVEAGQVSAEEQQLT